MKHYGDITQLSGYDLPVVDVITGGSPCQDLSVAGKRAGLDGKRSGLFMEQIRIVKEMREKNARVGRTAYMVRPRYMVWENVPGAFSSGNPKGADFQAVLKEIVGIVRKEAPTVSIPKDGWPKAGCISGVGDSGCTFSVCWRLHDAQFWGVPQRRKRITLVADFGGLSAPEILFERKGLSGDSDKSREERKGTAGGTGNGAESSKCFRKKSHPVNETLPQNWESASVSDTLNSFDYSDARTPTVILSESEIATEHHYVLKDAIPLEGNGARESHRGDGWGSIGDPSFTLNGVERHGVAYGISAYNSNSMKSKNPHSGIYKAETSRTLDLTGGSPACNQGGIAIVANSFDARGNGDGKTCPTITGDHQNRITDYTALVLQKSDSSNGKKQNKP